MHRKITAILSALLTLAVAVHATQTQPRDLSSAAGVQWTFTPENGAAQPIQVPAAGWKAQGVKAEAGTYRATVPIPASAAGQQVTVHFEAVNFGAEVFAGPDEEHLQKVASHVNGWMPFDADVTAIATPGQNLLLKIEVKGREKFKVNGKYIVPEAATWYAGLAEGILRGIRLEITPRVHIENVFVQTKRVPDTIRTFVTVANDSDKAVEVRLLQSAYWASPNKDPAAPRSSAAIPDLSVKLAPGEHQVLDSGLIPWGGGPQSYWWPNVPYRAGYRTQVQELSLRLESGPRVHTVQQKFGFREFKVVGNHYELNGVRCNLRGDNQQEANFGPDAYGIKPGFGPPIAGNPGWPQAVDNLLRLNFNVMRIHQVPATPYMLDICDQKGLMIVDETPLRRSEQGEDWDAGREHATNMVRELARRDRNHPSVVIFSAMNEPFGVKVEMVRELIEAMRKEDGTRPIIADGIGNLAPDIINMEHYVSGIGKLPQNGGQARTDRPYGETEAVWSEDNTRQGFAWMATSVRLRRLKGNSDLRNYVLNNAWSNYVPGESPATQVLETKVKNWASKSHEILPPLEKPWEHPNILLMQQCYHPLTACDVKFDALNARSNEKGEWPVIKPKLTAGKRVMRQIAVFNDEFEGEDITLRWQVHATAVIGVTQAEGEVKLTIPRGEFRTQEVWFNVPQTGDVNLVLSVWKDGKERFREDKIVFTVSDVQALADGDYYLLNRNSGHPLDTGGDKDGAPVFQNAKEAAKSPVWKIKLLGNDDLQIVNAKTGLALAVRGGEKANEVPIVQQTPDNSPAQIWHFAEVEDGFYTLTNKASGKLLDVYARATGNDARVVQWEANGGENQQWSFEKR